MCIRDSLKVIAPIDDTPAQRAGIRAGDLIIRLDDVSVKGMALADAIQKMRGKPNTPVSYTHLDVYKRQAECLRQMGGKGRIWWKR